MQVLFIQIVPMCTGVGVGGDTCFYKKALWASKRSLQYWWCNCGYDLFCFNDNDTAACFCTSVVSYFMTETLTSPPPHCTSSFSADYSVLSNNNRELFFFFYYCFSSDSETFGGVWPFVIACLASAPTCVYMYVSVNALKLKLSVRALTLFSLVHYQCSRCLSPSCSYC